MNAADLYQGGPAGSQEHFSEIVVLREFEQNNFLHLCIIQYQEGMDPDCVARTIFIFTFPLIQSLRTRLRRRWASLKAERGSGCILINSESFGSINCGKL